VIVALAIVPRREYGRLVCHLGIAASKIRALCATSIAVICRFAPLWFCLNSNHDLRSPAGMKMGEAPPREPRRGRHVTGCETAC
jgi:hypothetical protein